MIHEAAQRETVSKFVDAAKHFCDLLEARHRSKLKFFAEVLRATVELYHAGLALPEVEPEESYSPLGKWGEANKHLPVAERLELDPQLREHSERYQRVIKRVVSNLAGDRPYREVFNPFDPDDTPVTGTVADALSDIYCDLQRGLATLTKSGHPSPNVVWQWKCDLESHWGRHAASVMHPLHVLAFNK